MVRNVVLVCLDTVRKDYFDRFAPRVQKKSSFSFENCRAAASWTVPSHASMFSEQLPHQHGIHTHNRNFGALSREETFVSDLPDHRILGASANVHASPAFGFDTLFDEFVPVTPYNRFPAGMDVKRYLEDRDESGLAGYLDFARAALEHPHTFETLANGVSVKLDSLSKRLPLPKLSDDGARGLVTASERLIEQSEDPFFLFVNFMDAHPPLQHTRGYDRSLHCAPNTWTSLDFDYWEVRTEHDLDGNEKNLEHFRNLYAAAIDYLDRVLLDFVDMVRAVPDAETTVIITADHGEDLGTAEEERRLGHLGSLSEGLLHVPCHVVNPPDGWEPEDDGYFSHLDLGTLVRSLTTETTPDVTDDRAVAEIVGGMSADFDAPLTDEEFRYWNRMQRCAYDGNQKTVWDSRGNSILYELDLETASSERRIETGVTPPAWTSDAFDTDLTEYKRQARQRETEGDDIDDVTEQRLADLGYL